MRGCFTLKIRLILLAANWIGGWWFHHIPVPRGQ